MDSEKPKGGKWKWMLGGLCLVLLLLGINLLQPAEPDGLDWIRKYKPTSERVFEPPLFSGRNISIRTKTVRYEFHFKDGIPQSLLDEIVAKLIKEYHDLEKGLPVTNDYIDAEKEQNLVLVERITLRSWPDQQWRKFRRSIGMLPIRQP